MSSRSHFAGLPAGAFLLAAVPLIAQGDPRPAERFLTDRDSDVELALTDEAPMFQFAVFGDRTGGPADGVKVLAEAVRDTNVIRPDLVMTVGDMVQGYNTTPQWRRQMTEYKGIMDGLAMPWYPVAGNHDVYWRGPERPPLEHEGNYETHFGPLWYAFEHKDCWFIALFSDETNPDTGRKDFGNPDNHRMSSDQFEWLDTVLARTEDAEHVFVFLHHPRWFRGRYGDHWERVHARLVAAGNVTAVFAGHVHHMRYDAADDIEYFTMATIGGGQSGAVPRAGWLHHFNLVTVREDSIAVATLPVGEVIDHRALSQDLLDEALAARRRMAPGFDGRIALDGDFAVDDELTVQVQNPTDRPLDLTLVPSAADPRWRFMPDHLHRRLEPEAELEFRLQVSRLGGGLDGAFALPQLELRADLITEASRIEIPARRHALPVDVELPDLGAPDTNHVLSVDGDGDWATVGSRALELPDGPLTVEAWCRADSFADRVGLCTKTENSEFGIFVNGGKPHFSVHLDGRYRTVRPRDDGYRLPTDRFVHVAGVFDGEELRLYIDGALQNRTPAAGSRTRNELPFIVGADVDRNGRGTSPFHGAIDEVRISSVARYRGSSFEPSPRHAADARTVLLLHMDRNLGPWLRDASPQSAHAERHGDAWVTPNALR